MRVLRVILWLLICARAWDSGQGVAQAAAASLARTEFYGKSYARLGEWARANGFDMRWAKGGAEIRLSNRFAQFIFTKDSRESVFSGINVCLSYPIVVRDGVAFISQVDLDTAIGPILFPPKNRNGAKIKNIVLDPGHGGKDPGNQIGSQQEKKYTLLMAQELRDQLKAAGFNVSLTRTSDDFIDLPTRPEIARRRGADLFISVHWNELPGRNDVKGAQVFCLTPAGASSSNAGGRTAGAGFSPGNQNNDKNMFLAFALQQSLVKKLGVEDHGVRRARYWILRDATMPAVLIEGGFMSNPAEAKRIYDPAYRRQMAHAIVEGILAYQRQVQ